MRKFVALLALGLLFSTTSCKKIDELTQFTLDYQTEITIPSSVGINLPFSFPTPAIKTNSTSAFEVNDTRKDLIEQINLTELLLTLTSPQGSDFSFLKSIEIYISTANEPEILLAWKEDIEANVGSTLELETSTADLQAYIKADEFNLRASTVTRELIMQDHKIQIDASFFVDAKILGV